ncbi:MAG: sigma-70 family RNA polymerase sigma factor [Planctomycetota bacterium]
MQESDADLVHATRSGRRDAYGLLVRRFAVKIRAVCMTRLGRLGPVDDMVQETFLRALRALDHLAEPDKFGSWLYGIALRTCMDWLKAKERTQVSLDATPHQPAAAPEPDERVQRLLEEVHALPEIYREVIVLFYYDRQSYQEMGDLLGITAAAVNARLTKARAMLRERLAAVVEP